MVFSSFGFITSLRRSTFNTSVFAVLVLTLSLENAISARVNPHIKIIGSDVGLLQQNQEEIPRERSESMECTQLDNEIVGCASHCKCSWHEKCYPKLLTKQQVHDTLKGLKAKSSAAVGNAKTGTTETMIDVGVCDHSMPVLFASSFALFTVVLAAFVALRTLLLWIESDEPPLLDEKSDLREHRLMNLQEVRERFECKDKARSGEQTDLPEFVPVEQPVGNPGPPGSTGSVDSESDEASTPSAEPEATVPLPEKPETS
jgi:hypothetical protein